MEEDGGGGAGVDTAGLFGGVNFSGNGAALHAAAAVAADAPEEESPDVCRLARMALDVQDLMAGGAQAFGLRVQGLGSQNFISVLVLLGSF